MDENQSPLIRIKWSQFEPYHPIKIIISDWANVKKVQYGRNSVFMLARSILEYNGQMIELCVPYHNFVTMLMKLPINEQRLIVSNNAIITLMKTYKYDHHGMVIEKVEQWKKSDGG